jgi:hypothetical protein
VSAIHRALVVLGFALAVAVLAGILRRKRVAQCIAFTLLVSASAGFTGLFLVYPKGNSPALYLVKQGIYDSLLFAIALELSFRAFSAFRGVADRVRFLLAFAVTASTAGIFFLTPNSPYSQFWRYQPSVTTAGIWCLTAVALLVVWYQIRGFLRAIILAYVPYLVVFVICVDLIGRLGWGAIPRLNILNAAAYDAMATYWAWAAWRKD